MLPNVIFSHEEVNKVSRNDDRLKLNDSSRPENWLYFTATSTAASTSTATGTATSTAASTATATSTAASTTAATSTAATVALYYWFWYLEDPGTSPA